ncbi:hypothetical protein MCAMS1_02695 [biofilm metagenome]
MKKLLIIFLLIFIQGCSKTEDKVKSYLESGKSFYQKGNYDKAKIEFKNVIQLDAKQAVAYYHLALIDEKNQNWQGMFGNLSQVAKLNPKNNDALLKLARLTLLSEHADEALGHVETVLKNNPEDPDALALKGAIYIKQNNLEGAMALAEQVLEKHPDHTDAVSLKTVTYMSKNDLSAALATVEKALQTKPSDLSLLLLKLQVHTQNKDNAAIEQDYLNLIKQFPDKLDYTYALVKYYVNSNQDEKAISTLQATIDAHPNDMQPKLVMIDYQIQKKPELADKTLADFLAKYPQEPELYFRSAAINLNNNKIADAKQALTKITELKPDSKEGSKAKIMLAKLALQENDTAKAQDFVKSVLAKDAENLDGLLLKGRLDLQKGVYDDVISSMRVVLRDYSNSDEALVLIGQAYLKKNSPELAEENFRKALEINPANFDALMPVASNLIKNKEVKRAEELLNKALTAKPDHPAALQALAQVKMLQKDWTGTQKVADIINNNPKGSGYSKFLSGKISQEQGLHKEAIGQFKEALQISPDLQDALRGLVTSYDTIKDPKAMLAYLQEFMAKNPENAYAWLLKGQVLAKEGKSDDALKVLSEAIGKWPKAAELYEAVASIYNSKKDSDKAIEAINQGLAAVPDQPRLSIILASTYEQIGSFDKALEIYETINKKYPTIEIVTNNLVSLLLDHFNTKENIDRALTLSKSFEKSEQPYYVDSYAWALVNAGKNEEALNLLREVVKKAPNVPVFRYHLGAAYQKTNSTALAKTELEQAIELGKKTGGFPEQAATEKLLSSINTGTP